MNKLMRIQISNRLFFMFAILLIVCATQLPAIADTVANKALGLRVFDEVWNQGKIEVIDEIVGDGYVIHDPSGDFVGSEGYKQFHAMFNSAFSDIHFTVEDQVAEGDWVATRWTSTSNHTGELMGIPATGNSILVTGITASHIVDGKVMEEWNEWHMLGLLEQIGAVPSDKTDYSWGESSQVSGDAGDPLANKLQVISYTEQVWNLKRMHAIEDSTSIELIAHAPDSSTNPKTFDKVKHDQSNFIAGMPDVNVEIQGLIAEGDKVAIRYTTSGTDLNSGKLITFSGVNINRFADGKIVENWWAYDSYAVMQQFIAPEEYSPVGTWIVTVPTPMGDIVMTHSIHAQDLIGKNYGGILKQYNTNPTLFGMFPEWEAGGDIWAAQTVRTGPDSFETTLMYHTTKKGEGPVAETVGIGISNATWKITGPDTNEGESTLAVYLAEQDADGDGLPDEGEEPAVCMGFTYTSKRLTMMPGCVPPPMPEE